MTVSECPADALDLVALRGRVDEALASFLREKRDSPCGALIGGPLAALGGFVALGGKRVRPLFCCVGWHAAGGGAVSGGLLRVAAGLELFHTATLVHDDVIDDSRVRRGSPTVHRVLAAGSPGARGDWFGRSSAVLLGDLCAVWSAELLGPTGAAGSSDGPVRDLLDRMRAEVLVGQLLDLEAARGPGTVRAAIRVIHYKTTQYTVKRPLQIGAAMAGAGATVLDALGAYAEPLGEAFQLLDDLEDVSADADPGCGGEDLREGKQTVVLALAYERATAAQARRLRELVGAGDLDEDGIAEARTLIEATGAPRTVRRMVAERRRLALAVLDAAPFPEAAAAGLAAMADLALPGVARWEDAAHEDEPAPALCRPVEGAVRS